LIANNDNGNSGNDREIALKSHNFMHDRAILFAPYLPRKTYFLDFAGFII